MLKREERFYQSFVSARSYDITCFRSALQSASRDDAGNKDFSLVSRQFPSLYQSTVALDKHNRQMTGFKVRRYRSGEMTGAQYTTGSRNLMSCRRDGEISTETFTQPARQKIRRAVENSDLPLNYFLTFTFSPRDLHPWQVETYRHDSQVDFMGPVYPCVRHDFAKHCISNLVDALRKHVKRRYSQELLFVWVAELHSYGGIHFHMLVSHRLPVDYMRRLWGRGRIHAKYIDDNAHATNYIRKYLTKGECATIKGNRYNICRALRETMKPEEINIANVTQKEIREELEPHKEALQLIHTMREEIESRGGYVIDFGFSIPAPRREKVYRDRKGRRKKTSKVDSRLACDVFRLLVSEDENPF